LRIVEAPREGRLQWRRRSYQFVGRNRLSVGKQAVCASSYVGKYLLQNKQIFPASFGRSQERPGFGFPGLTAYGELEKFEIPYKMPVLFRMRFP
jgi:hypothetical protein